LKGEEKEKKTKRRLKWWSDL